jgi:hypothetical protein
MKRATLAFSVLMLLTMLPSPAAADSVTIVDPIIGVRGGKFGSVPITNSESQTIGQTCGSFEDSELAGIPADYLCLPYQITSEFLTTGIFSVDLSFTQDGTPIPNGFLTPFSQTHDLAQSDFTAFERVGDFTVRLSGGNGANGQILCQDTPVITLSSSYESPVTYHPCTVGEDVMVYLGPDPGSELMGTYQVSLTNVNGVPEPATLMLMGTAAAVFAGRRLRRKTQ